LTAEPWTSSELPRAGPPSTGAHAPEADATASRSRQDRPSDGVASRPLKPTNARSSPRPTTPGRSARGTSGVHTCSVAAVDVHALRASIRSGTAQLDVSPLLPQEIESIGWSGTRMHLDNVLAELGRVAADDVEYLTLRADGLPVAKGGSTSPRSRELG
jgi:hypothetical protein